MQEDNNNSSESKFAKILKIWAILAFVAEIVLVIYEKLDLRWENKDYLKID